MPGVSDGAGHRSFPGASSGRACWVVMYVERHKEVHRLIWACTPVGLPCLPYGAGRSNVVLDYRVVVGGLLVSARGDVHRPHHTLT
jgi:hypothetical protein